MRALIAPGAAGRSKRWFDALREAARASAAELSWLLPGKRAQGFAHAELEAVRGALHLAATANDAALLLRAPPSSRAAGQLRTRVAEELALVDKNTYRSCWVVDFPMYERDPATGAIVFSHNPLERRRHGVPLAATVGA